MHFCHPHLGGFFAVLLQIVVDQVNAWMDAFLRRSPHLDEQADASQPAERARFSAHDLPILIPPPR